jgi:cell wall-associated NlpC family hydrolase
VSRVAIEFDGNSRGAVGAAKETVTAIDQVKRTTAEQAASNISKRVEERRSLQELAAEYTKVATTAKRGSEQQVSALKLEQRALRELADTHGVYTRRLQSSTKEVERFSKGAILGSGALGHIGRTAALASGAFLSGVGLIQVFKDATNEGASLSTQMERTSKVFGASAGDIKAWSKASVDALGLARAETLDYANSIGQLLINMKLAPAAAATMSKALLQRAADVATEKNVPTGDVVGAFTAALNGQVRGLREYGISLDTVRVKQEAERLGLVKNTVDLGKVHDATEQVRIAKYNLGVQEQKHGVQSAEAAKATIAVDNAERALAKSQKGHAETLTAGQRAQATYNAILDQTGKQQGYIATHTDDLTVQERKLHAEVKTLYEQMGTGLIPMLLKYLPHLTDWIDKNEKNGTFQKDFNEALKTGEQVVGAVTPLVKHLANIWGQLSDAVGGNAHAIELVSGLLLGTKLLGGFKALEAAAGEKGAAGAVQVLTTRLRTLGALGVIAVAIEIVIHRKQIDDIGNKITDWFTKAQQGGAINDLAKVEAGIANQIPGVHVKWQDLTKSLNGRGGVDAGGGSLAANAPTARSADLLAQAQAFSGGQYAWGGGHGGTETPDVARNKGLDCSGFISQVFAGAGFEGFAGTSEVLLALCQQGRGKNWYAVQVNRSDVEAGDVAFADNAGHVGLVVSGKGSSAKILAYSAPDAGGKGLGEKVDPMSNYWGPFYRVYLIDKNHQPNTSGHSNDPVSDAGGGNRTPTTTGTTTTDASTATHPFVEKPKVKKVHDPIASYRTALKTGIAQINDDVDKGLLPKSIGDRLDQRAQAIQKSLVGATKADIPKIRTQMKDLNAAVSSALRATRDQALLGKDEGQIRTDVKDGLLSKAVGDSLIKQAQAINARLVADIFDPKKSAADDAAVKGFRARIAAMLSQAAEVRTIDADLSKMATDQAQALDQALGVPIVHATDGAVAKAKAGIAKIRAEFASNKILPPAERTKLKQQLTAYEATVSDGMAGVIDVVTAKRTKLETAWGRLSSAAFSAFDKETSQHLAKMQDDVKAAIDAMTVTVQGSGFASFLFGGPGAQTPTELLLAQRQAAKTKADDIQSITDATKQLADAQAALAAYGGATGGTDGVAGHDAITNAAGDSVTGIGAGGTSGTDDLASLQQAVVDAQKALDDAKYQQESDDLDAQAQLERDAADKQLSDAQDAAQKLADQQQQDYQDQRDAQRQHIQDMLDDELTAIETGQKTLSQAMTELGGALGMNLAQAFATWFDPTNPDSVASTLAGFLYQVNLAKGLSPSQAAVAALGSLPPPTGPAYDPATGEGLHLIGSLTPGADYTQLPSGPTAGVAAAKFGQPWTAGFASGGWADDPRPVVDPRDTIPALLRRGEYVMNTDEVAAGGPSWARGRGGGGDLHVNVTFSGGTFIGARPREVAKELTPHIANQLQRQIGYTNTTV